MKYAADFRKIAREALKGHWIISALACFIASLVGGNIIQNIKFNFESNTPEDSSASLGSVRITTENLSEFIPLLLATLSIMLFIALITIAIMLTVGGPLKLGYAKYNLGLVDKNDTGMGDLFSQFGRFTDGFVLNLLLWGYTLLWSMLFIVPGIIKSLSYSMAPYILYEDTNISANDAITESRRIMDGNKWRLFCLRFSFIGWSILASLPAAFATGIATTLARIGGTGLALVGFSFTVPFSIASFVLNCFVASYMECAQAAFYREITGTALEYKELPATEANETM